MKTLIILSFALFLSLSPVFPRQFPTSPPVVDVNGKELKLNAAYYAVSTTSLNPEGLCLVDVNNQSKARPHDVVQCTLSNETLLGSPVTFSAVDPTTEDHAVRENTVYNVKFSVARNFSNETVWALAEARTPNQSFVTTDPNATAVQFQAQKFGLGYKIVYCVVIPIPRTPICYSIGLIPDFGYNRLGIGLGLKPAQFFFKNNATSVDKTATF